MHCQLALLEIVVTQRLRLNKNADRHLKAGHLWIYSNEVDIKERNKRHKIYFRYLRALCYKVMGEFEKSQKDYKDILGAFELEEGSKFANYIFHII